MQRRDKPLARRPVPQPFLHVHPWRSPTAQPSTPRVAASRCTALASRESCIPSRPISRAHPVLMGALPVSHRHTSLGGLPSTSCGNECAPLLHVLPWRTVPDQATFCCHPKCHPCVNNPAYPLYIFSFLLLFPRLQLLLILSQLFLPCSGNLAYPSSRLFRFLDCVARVDQRVSMRACAFASQPHSNLSRVGDRSYACDDESLALLHRAQPIRTCTDPPLLFLFPAWPRPSPCTSFSNSLLTSARARSSDRATARHLRFVQFAQEFHVILVLPLSLLPGMILALCCLLHTRLLVRQSFDPLRAPFFLRSEVGLGLTASASVAHACHLKPDSVLPGLESPLLRRLSCSLMTSNTIPPPAAKRRHHSPDTWDYHGPSSM